MLELLTDGTLDLAGSAARHGCGLFETLRISRGRPLRLGAHLERLGEGLRFLGMEPAPSAREVLAFLDAATPCPTLSDGVLRLVAVDRRLLVLAAPWEEEGPGEARLGVSARIRRLSSSPLNRFKTLSYLENRLLAREARARGLLEVLALNERLEVTDGGRTSLFALVGGRLVTPPVEDGALPGVARRAVLEAGLAEVGRLRVSDLERAQALVLTNSLRGAVPVQAFEGGGPLDREHPRVRALREVL
jgi:branched-chain amino acid aminotransferase